MNRDARKNVEYDSFAKTFSNSRKNMKWEEISYFLWFLDKNINILDIWCWNGRFLWELKKIGINKENYLWLDLSVWLIEEAIKFHPWFNFKELNMLDLNKLINLPFSRGVPVGGGVSYIFFIASFHHLNSIGDRLEVLKNTYNLLEAGWMIFMTNWALDSQLNNTKYNNSIIKWSNNKFWSTDYNIKIWKYERFYHCFSLDELEYLSKEAWFDIIENREFENKKNYILILKKR